MTKRGYLTVGNVSLATALAIVLILSATTPAAASSPPDASFTYSPSTPNPGDTITLDASGATDNGTIVSYEWDGDGDGRYSEYDDDPNDGETASVTYDSGGTRTVGLRVTDQNGNTDTYTTQITVDNPAPDASFSFSPTGPNPDDRITLDASSSSDPDGSITSYEWDGDGDGRYSEYDDDLDDGETASVTFGSGGTYTVGLRVTDNGGKEREITKQITVDNPAPDASFSFSPTSPNPDDRITLDASGSSDSDGSITSYEWDGDGDGQYSEYDDDPNDGETASVTFGSGGTYTVGLRVTDNGGKEREITKQITVDNPAPDPSFSYSPTSPNPDDRITLDASGSSDPDGSIVSYEWDGDGDGQYSEYDDDPNDGETASITFGSGGTYTVGLRITDNGGKEREITKQITVDNPAPTAEFTYSPSNPNPDDRITLDASGSSDSDGSITSYKWDGDGDGRYSEYDDDPDDGETASVTFGSGGTYTVGLRVTDNGGKEREITKQITVDNPAPDPSFSHSPTSPNPDDRITLDASGSSDSDGSITSYKWDGDGDGQYGEYDDDPDDGETASVTFGSGGTYTVGLKITDNGGKERTITRQITVDNPAPDPSFSYSPTSPNPDDRITLDASGSSDSDGSITSYKWDDDGDGRYSEYDDDPTDGETATISFDSEGTYSVSLQVTDNGGKTRTVTKEITVKNIPPNPSFFYSPSSPRSGDRVTLDARSSSDPDGEVVSYEWITNGELSNENDSDGGKTATVRLYSGGTQKIRLQVTDRGGKTRSVSKEITVRNEPPTANFTHSVSDANSLEVNLDATGSTDTESAIERYEWYVDDRLEATGQTASVEFSNKGSYHVKLVVYDRGGAQTGKTKTVGVSQSPTATISPSQTPVALGQSVEFTAADATDPDGTIESISWRFPDGSTKRGSTVSKVFSSTGTKEVTVTLTDDTGNKETITRTVSVRKPPEVSFSWTPDSPADDNTVEFTASAQDSVDTYEWDFDTDGEVDATGQTVENAFPDGGEKTVTLYAHGSNDVTNRLSRTVEVRQVPPKASFSWQPEVPRDKQDIVFNASSPDDIRTFAWDFDNDGTVEREGKTVTHAFPTDGKQAVVLQVEESTGDTANYTEVVTVQQSAGFDLTTSQSTAAVGDEVIAQFSASNNVRDRSLDVKLRLDLPPSGVSITSVDGGQLVSRQSTNFVTIEPGGSETLRITMQVNEAGNYSIGGTALYYFGEDDSSGRREASVEPVNITVNTAAQTSTPGESGPGFSAFVALLAVVFALAIGRSISE